MGALRSTGGSRSVVCMTQLELCTSIGIEVVDFMGVDLVGSRFRES